MRSKEMSDAEFDRRVSVIEAIKGPARRERAKEALARRVVRDVRSDVESANKVLRHISEWGRCGSR